MSHIEREHIRQQFGKNWIGDLPQKVLENPEKAARINSILSGSTFIAFDLWHALTGEAPPIHKLYQNRGLDKLADITEQAVNVPVGVKTGIGAYIIAGALIRTPEQEYSPNVNFYLLKAYIQHYSNALLSIGRDNSTSA